jgi:hypothetical protein
MKEEGRRKQIVSFLLPSLFVVSLVPVSAAITAARHSEPLPKEIHSALAAQLNGKEGVRASVSGVTLDFWWTSGVSLSADGPPAWTAVPEGALVGAVKIGSSFRDIRGRIIKPGVYTLRYGLQPDNGDHLGVSPNRHFLLISPAADDQDPGPQGHDATVELSTGSVGGSHPGVWSIDPPAATRQPVLSVHTTDLGHEALIVEVPASRNGKPAGTLKFGIVLVGKIEA